MTRLAFFAALFTTGAGLALAQSISQQCSSALITVAASPDASCLNVQGLLPLLTTPNASLVQPINSWLTTACSLNPCTDSQLAAIVTNITTGCGGDLASFGVPSVANQTVIQAVQQGYPTVRDIVCLTDKTNNTLCATDTLNNLQAVVGTLSIDNIISQLPALVMGQLPNVPQSVKCTDCIKAAYNVLKQEQPSLASSNTVQNALESQCGSSFIDGSAPSQILEGTGSAAPTGSTNTNGALSFLSSGAWMGVAFSSLTALSTAFVVLA